MDLRPGLIKMAHPAGNRTGDCLGSQPRTGDRGIHTGHDTGLHAATHRTTGTAPRPPDRVPLLGSEDQWEWTEKMLLRIAAGLPERRDDAIREWVQNAFHNDSPTD